MTSIHTRRHGPGLTAVLLLLGALGLAGCRDDKAPGTTSPTGGGAPAASASALAPASTQSIKLPPPAVAGGDEAKKLAGTKITYYGESVGVGAELDKVMARRFSEDTGIQVNVVPRPKDSTESYAVYQRLFQGQSADVDVLMLDVIWPGAFSRHLSDLGPRLGEAARQHVQTIVQNDTVDGKLVAIPWFTDFGLLYYRTDLLKKYGHEGPPETWDELEQISRKIMDGERASSPNLAGFVWQGKAYEGLTCNALEWIYSHGGGVIIEDGKPTVNNPQAAKALARARGWVGTISPAGVSGYEEEDARNTFQGGNAVFMRNWPYAYAAGNDERSPIKGKFDVAPLPHEPGQKSAGTAGGWQLGVSRYSKNQDAAIELVRYLTGPEGQKYRALAGGYIPTIPSVQSDPEVAKALPFLVKLKDLTLVTRPSSATGARYNEASIAFFQGVSLALQKTEPSAALQQVEQRLQRVLR